MLRGKVTIQDKYHDNDAASFTNTTCKFKEAAAADAAVAGGCGVGAPAADEENDAAEIFDCLAPNLMMALSRL